MFSENSQSRKWLLTINNPDKFGLKHEVIIEIAQRFHPTYFCLVDEVATTGTLHTHLFIYSRSPIRFKTIQNRFPNAHIDKASGSAIENRNYLRKEGKWADSDKAKTNLIESFEEFGEIPQPNEESNPGMAQLISCIEEGMPTYDIIKSYPQYGFRTNQIESIRQLVLSKNYSSRMRSVKVIYVCGPTATGKTRGIYKKHATEEICRITVYKNGMPNFDGYNAHPVLVFEEFASQVPIEAMLNYLDIYPLMLPARYSDKLACYTTVYLTSNLPLEKQYVDAQMNKPETWKAFCRRINVIREYTGVNKYTETELNPVVALNDEEGKKDD